MLTISIPKKEFFNEETMEFVVVKEQEIKLEHSLLSVSKWESKWHKPFLGQGDDAVKTDEELLDYIRCMTVTSKVDPIVYFAIPALEIDRINDYISDPMTATWFSKDARGGYSREIITAELIYYWMIALNIPFECEKWHLNRLLTLIQVCNIKNQPPKSMKKNEVYQRNRDLNAQRRKQLGTTG
ncbi:MAG: hypothetical protein [Chaetfec virus UA24_144]|nr:MAG: hypothetical protein [Chaetfec virus UA24_144]